MSKPRRRNRVFRTLHALDIIDPAAVVGHAERYLLGKVDAHNLHAVITLERTLRVLDGER